MVSIQTIQNQDQLKELFQFFARTFYEDAIIHQEHYFTMGERYEEMRKQFCMDPDLLMYVEVDGKIIAGLTGKGMDLEHKKITLSVLAVDPDYRRKGYAKCTAALAAHHLIENGICPQWECHAENTASIALAESIGYEKYGVAYILEE